MMAFTRKFLCCLFLAIQLSACASGSSAISQSLQLLWANGTDAVDQASLDPNKRYLRVTVGERSVLMVLGYLQTHPDGEIETWYSAKGEVIQIQQGRIIKTAGLSTDWREVRFPEGLPSWSASLQAAQQYRRSYDEMPTYRLNINETLTLKSVIPSSDRHLLGLRPDQLLWFEEHSHHLPPNRYALQRTDHALNVIYAEHCLSLQLCLSWQRWPVAPQAITPPSMPIHKAETVK